MKQYLFLISLLFGISITVTAQKSGGPAEKKFTDAICNCMSGLNFEPINTKAQAEKVFMECFTKEPALIIELAEERKIDVTNHPAMRKLGVEIGKNLAKQNCKGFIALSMIMAKEETPEPGTGVTEGKFTRLDAKDFNYFILTDAENKEKSFIWLRQFPGSEAFTNSTSKFTDKKIKISWQEMEVYIPSAKSYYTIKEVTGIELL